MQIPAEFFAISGFINFFTSLFLAVLLFVKSRHIKANRYFAYFCLFVAYWSFFYAVQFATADPGLQMFFLIQSMIGSFFIPASFVHFIKHFLKRNIPTWFIYFNYIVAATATAIAYTPLYAHTMDQFMGVWWLRRGPLFDVTFLHFGLIVTYSFWCIYDVYRKATDHSFKHQLRMVASGMLIGFLGGTLNFNFWYRIPIPPVTNVCVSIYVIMVTYAILKYQFMDIKIIIKNSLIYSILVSALTLIYFVMIYLVERFLQGVIGYESRIASLATAIIIAVCFIPLKDFIQFLVEKYIFKATYAQVIEQNERLRQEIMVSERYKSFSEITRSVASAIRSPLTVLKTYSYYFQDRMDDREFLQKFSGVLRSEIQEMEDMTNELTQYSSPEPLVLERVNVKVLLDEVLKGLEPQLMERKIELQKNYAQAASFWFEVDPKQLRQALLNVIHHSFLSMPKGGELWISAEKTKNFFIISIKDNGIPIPRDQREKIFDPFYRYNEEDHGLKLAIAFSIIESHGGTITVGDLKEAGNQLLIHLPTPE